MGSIPPGTINLSVLQYALLGNNKAALSFAVAAALTEYIYAAIAVKFQMILISNDAYAQYFSFISGGVLIVLGLYNLMKKNNNTHSIQIREKRNAFKKGVLISLANPLAIPFWLMVTTYLQSMNIISLTETTLWLYVAGVSTGTFLLLFVVVQLGRNFSKYQESQLIVYRLPGVLFLIMGIWSFL